MAARSEIAGGVLQAWGRILAGYLPNLSIEITRECPLRCPGCDAYGDAHLGGGVTLRGLSDYRGDELVQRFMDLVDRHKPLHVSIVGGEPLVRYRELGTILPRLAARTFTRSSSTSAVRPSPTAWRELRRLQVVVPSMDYRRSTTNAGARPPTNGFSREVFPSAAFSQRRCVSAAPSRTSGARQVNPPPVGCERIKCLSHRASSDPRPRIRPDRIARSAA